MDRKTPTHPVRPHFKETDLASRFKGVADRIPIHQVQYSFDTEERERAFVEAMFPTEDELARYRVYRTEWHRRPKENDPGPAPLAVCCELVSTCDLACSMCYTITRDFRNSVAGSNRLMPWPLARRVIDECAELGVASLLLSWRGEPTLYRWRDGDRVVTFPDVVAYARRRGILEITAITHGQNIDDAMAAAIVAAEPSWISFSVDGMEDDYNKIRTPPHVDPARYDAFATVIANIGRLVRARRAAGWRRPQIRTNAIFPAVARDPDRYRRTLLDVGVDMITVNELLDLRAGGLDADHVNEDWGCQYPFQRLSVTTGGTVLPCTGAYLEQSGLALGRYRGFPPRQLRDAEGREISMDMPELSLAEAWHCSKLETIRSLHQGGRRCEIDPGCRDCNHGARKHGYDRAPEDWDSEAMRWMNERRRG